MVDIDGVSIPVDVHIDIYNCDDNWFDGDGIEFAEQYIKLTGDRFLKNAVEIIKNFIDNCSAYGYEDSFEALSDLCERENLESGIFKARNRICKFYGKDLMRVRVGGETYDEGIKEVYFRIPGTDSSRWHKAIAEFLFDYRRFKDYRVSIYKDEGQAGGGRLLEEYNTADEFLNLV